jgi:hypothetical protein
MARETETPPPRRGCQAVRNSEAAGATAGCSGSSGFSGAAAGAAAAAAEHSGRFDRAGLDGSSSSGGGMPGRAAPCGSGGGAGNSAPRGCSSGARRRRGGAAMAGLSAALALVLALCALGPRPAAAYGTEVSSSVALFRFVDLNVDEYIAGSGSTTRCVSHGATGRAPHGLA